MTLRTITLAIVATALTLACPAGAVTYEVTRADQLNTLVGTATSRGTAIHGDRIHVSGPGPYTAPSGGWHIRQSIELFGDGRGLSFNDDSSTVLRAADRSSPVLVLDVSASTYALQNVHIHDLQIRGRNARNATSDGIVFDNVANPSKLLSGLRLERLLINDMGNDGIRLVGVNIGAGAVVRPAIIDCWSAHNYGNGLTLKNSTVAHVLNGSFNLNRQHGARISSSNEPQIVSSTFQSNQMDGGSTTLSAQLLLESAHAFRIEGCHFETFDATASKTAITVGGGLGGYIGANSFVGGAVAGGRGILVPGSAVATSISIAPNMFSDVDILVELADSPFVSSCVIQPQPVFSASGVTGRLIIPDAADRGHIVVPATRIGSPPDWRFNLTAGIAFPRLSASKRDSLVAASRGGPRREGLVVYDSDGKRLNYWDGTQWRDITPNVFFRTTTAPSAPPGGVSVPAITTEVRNALPSAYVVPGALIFNTSTGELNYVNGSGAWRAVSNKDP